MIDTVDGAFPPFIPRAPWWGGDLQTLSNLVLRRRVLLDAYRHERFLLPARDGSGDRFAAILSTPAAPVSDLPLVVLIHGLGGSEASAYILRSTAHLLAQGHPVLRFNLRGAGPSRPFCRFHYHAGRSDDLADVLAALPADLIGSGVVAVGYSLGANLLLKYLGERGEATPLAAAVAVSAPLDLLATARRMMRWRNGLYQAYLLAAMRVEATAAGAELSPDEREAILGARSIWAFDHDFTAPRNGFTGAEDYYRRNSSAIFLGGIRVPTLVIYARDDPWIPAGAYEAANWRANAHLVPTVQRHGGHVGFQGKDRAVAWHDLAIGRFLAATISRRAAASPPPPPHR